MIASLGSVAVECRVAGVECVASCLRGPRPASARVAAVAMRAHTAAAHLALLVLAHLPPLGKSIFVHNYQEQ